MKRTYDLNVVTSNISDETLVLVRDKLSEKGLVSDLTPTENLPQEIEESLVELKSENIKEGVKIGSTIGSLKNIVADWDSVDTSKKELLVFSQFTNYYYHSNGIDAYGSYGSAGDAGLYHINLKTNEITQIYETGFNWKYFIEDNNGYTYISDASNAILYVTGSIAVEVQVSSSLITLNKFFKDSKGNIYVGGSGTTAILYLCDGIGERIQYSGYWDGFYEDKFGYVYAYNGTGVLLLDKNTVTNICTFTSQYSFSTTYYTFEASNGYLYVSASQVVLFCIYNGTATELYTNSKAWDSFFEDSEGNVYVGSTRSYSGILHVKESLATQIYNIGDSWRNFFEDSKGNVYASSGKSGTGLVKLTPTLAEQIYTESYNWKNFFESSNGNIYVSTSSSSSGMLLIKDNSVTQIYTGSNWNVFFEDSKSNIYVGSTSSSLKGILYINDDVVTLIYTDGYQWQHFYEGKPGYVYASSTYNNSASSGIIVLVDGVATKIYSSGYYLANYCKDIKDIVYVSSTYVPTNTSTVYGIICLDKDTATQIYKTGNNWYEIKNDENGILVSQNEQYIPNTEALVLYDAKVYKIKL